MSTSSYRVLLVSSLYPNSRQMAHGVFVENRIRALKEDAEAQGHAVEVVVIAPVPWFPFKGRLFGQYGQYAAVPFYEERYGIKIYHPRYLVIPKVGMSFTPVTYFHGLKRCLKKIGLGKDDFDLIDGHYLYPDGVAVSKLAKWLGLPFFVTARGSDVTQIAQIPRYGRKIKKTLGSAEQIICVSNSLKQSLIALGISSECLTVLRNGVDVRRFNGEGRTEGRKRYDLKRPTVVFVGGLIERKRVDLAVAALAQIQDVELLIAGDGTLGDELRRQVTMLGLTERVKFLGAVSPEEVPSLMAACDALILPSEREGWANVILEAIGSGTPVVASEAGAARDVLVLDTVGRVVEKQQAEDYAIALKQVLDVSRDRTILMEYARQFSWTATSSGQLALFAAAVDRKKGR